MSRNRDGSVGSRVSRRSGTKANVCMECQRAVSSKPGVTTRTVLAFRGRGKARLNEHLRKVHNKKV